MQSSTVDICPKTPENEFRIPPGVDMPFAGWGHADSAALMVFKGR